jgi:prepilin-type N-terminal cleavage/methylation domain-containing protein
MSLREARGLTLIEVIVATAVFALVVFIVTGFYVTASSQGVIGRGLTTGTLLAQQRIESLRGRGYTALTAGTTVETVDELGAADPAGRYTRTTVVTKPAAAGAGLAELDVTVSWLEGGTPRVVRLTTLVGDL